MSEAVYEQVERAIREKLCIAGRYRTHMGGPSYEYPVDIRLGNIVLRDADCGLVKPVRVITTDEWARLTPPLWRQVGFWDFAPADDPAISEIAFCHHNPESAGRELYRLRKMLQGATT